MTFSHSIDFDVSHAVIKLGDFTYPAVIAFKTKRALILHKLRESVLSETLVPKLHAPICLDRLDGKKPAEIVTSLATDLLLRLKDTATVDPPNFSAAMV